MRWNRRNLLGALGAASVVPYFGCHPCKGSESKRGVLIGEPTGERIAHRIFEEGGNAADAMIAGALAAAIAAPHQTGIGGYGATGIFAWNGGQDIVALDANSMAPQAMTSDLFASSKDGKPKHDINFGWKSAGVPGILAGLERIHQRFATKSLTELLQPAIEICEQGYRWPANVAKIIRDGAARFGSDPGSLQLYFREGEPLRAGELFTNRGLAEILKSFAKSNSMRAFYEGDVAKTIVASFQQNDGLVTLEDMKAYRAEWRSPYALSLGPYRLYTVPLTAGGLTVFQCLKLLQSLGWHQMEAGVEKAMVQVESMRWVWKDRLTLLGDPEHAKVPVERLLSDAYAQESAAAIRASLKDRKPIPHAVDANGQTGTIHLSAVDRDGNFAALTLTHGGSFGARVTVPDIGLTLGHGMSRFDPRPTHPNCPGPRKRPLHNMVPTCIYQEGVPVAVVGGRGGRKIPNAVLEFLMRYSLENASLEEAMKAPRMHTEGTLHIEQESTGDSKLLENLQQIGYQTKQAASATLSAVEKRKDIKAAMR